MGQTLSAGRFRPESGNEQESASMAQRSWGRDENFVAHERRTNRKASVSIKNRRFQSKDSQRGHADRTPRLASGAKFAILIFENETGAEAPV